MPFEILEQQAVNATDNNGVSILVASLDHIIESKAAVGRQPDLAALPELRTLRDQATTPPASADTRFSDWWFDESVDHGHEPRLKITYDAKMERHRTVLMGNALRRENRLAQGNPSRPGYEGSDLSLIHI